MRVSEYDEVKANLIKKSLEKNKTDVYVPTERRKGADGILNFVNLMCFFVWMTVTMAIACIIKAGKSTMYISENNLLLSSGEFWKIELLNTAFIITLVSIFICTLCIILNFTRHRRRTDRIKKSLVFCEILSLAVVIFLIFKLY